MQEIYLRVANWNSLRYEQKYDKNLTLSLLREEYKEWLEAEKPVDHLDALCDMSYVAMGGLWKLGVTEGMNMQYEDATHDIISKIIDTGVNPAYFVSTFLDSYEYNDTDSIAGLTMHLVITCSLMQALSMGLTLEDFFDAMTIVCDSNDSKSIKKTAANVKANIDKGAYFVPPEAKLTKLLEKVYARQH